VLLAAGIAALGVIIYPLCSVTASPIVPRIWNEILCNQSKTKLAGITAKAFA
jgi:hypothetical protein